MDNFMSKLSQKINAQDTIKANFMADMAEKEQMKKQLKEYDAILQSMRNLYLKQEENNEAFLKVAEKLEAMQQTDPASTSVIEDLKECIGKSDEFTHKECVKVYRNVQALLDEQNKKLDESYEELKVQMERMKAPDYSGDLEELKGIADAAAEAAAKSARSSKWWLVFVTLVSIVNLACILLIHFGLL